MEIEQAAAAGRAVGEVGLNALITDALIIRMIIQTPIIQISIIQIPISDALEVVTLDRFRSRIGSSFPVVFNLSVAQMLRLFSHWTHISII